MAKFLFVDFRPSIPKINPIKPEIGINHFMIIPNKIIIDGPGAKTKRGSTAIPMIIKISVIIPNIKEASAFVFESVC